MMAKMPACEGGNVYVSAVAGPEEGVDTRSILIAETPSASGVLNMFHVCSHLPGQVLGSVSRTPRLSITASAAESSGNLCDDV